MPDSLPQPSAGGGVVAAAEDSLAAARTAAVNGFDFLFRGGALLDADPLPATVIHAGPQNTVSRYAARTRRRVRRAPVLLVPPLAAPASCFDLRPGCSLAEHLLLRGHPTYLVDYGPIAFDDRALGLEHWIERVLPRAMAAASGDAGEPLHVVGWCLGGIMAALAAAARADLPVRTMTLIASPFDFRALRIGAPVRLLESVTGGALTTALYRTMGGVPAPLTSLAFKATALPRYLTRPVAVASHLGDREWLTHLKATDDYMNNMLAYPGRSFGQLFHRFFMVNDLVDGRLELTDHTIDLAEVRVPVLSIAGSEDLLAPRGAVYPIERLLPNSPRVEVKTAPGGHLGVLTGRGAALSTWRYFDEFAASAA